MDELEKITPNLSKLKRENPFGTPDKYFDDFSARLHSKLEVEKKVVSNQQNTIIRFLKPAIGLAASFALIFLLVYWPLKTFIPNQNIVSGMELTLDEMEYLSMVEGIDENSFYALLDNSNEAGELNEEDLVTYLSANLSEYEIYSGTDNYN